jgi:hypothetical protein
MPAMHSAQKVKKKYFLYGLEHVLGIISKLWREQVSRAQ